MKCPYLVRKVVMYMCLDAMNFTSLSMIFLLHFGTVLTVWYILYTRMK